MARSRGDKRPEMRVRREAEDERVLLVNAGATPEIEQALRPTAAAAGYAGVPGSITVGHYVRRDGALAFIPAPTALAAAALGTAIVQRRISRDLARRILDEV